MAAFVTPGVDLEVPLPGLKPFLFYLLDLILLVLPQERDRSLRIGVAGIAIDLKVVPPA
jgi:hypothetical protein